MTDRKLILVIEDNDDNITLVRRALVRSGVPCEIAVACDDVQARDFLYGVGSAQGRDVSRTPDLILLDINLPRLSGLDLLRLIRIQQRTKHVPVVVFTSSAQEKDVEAAYARGANSYVRKSVDYARFAETVGLIATYWLSVNERPATAAAGSDAAG